MVERQAIRVRYDRRETGWATPLQHNLAVIENIPLTERCNALDVVRLEPELGDGLPWVGEVVERRYNAKSLLHYHSQRDLELLRSLLQLLGCATESARRPTADGPGVLLVAHDASIRPALLAQAVGVSQPQEPAEGALALS